MKTKIIVILGPTAVGKTALGIKLAQKYKGEIISGDSQQVYRKLNIGTAKATAAEQAAAPHHLIDVRDINENYSAFDFVQEAAKAIQTIQDRGHLPIIVGGTGLYLQSLLEGYHLGGQVNHEAVLAYRKSLEELSDKELFDLLKDKNMTSDQLNRRRAVRSLELYRFSQGAKNQKRAYEVLLLGLNDDRQKLYERINARVDNMMLSGLLEEARMLYQHYPDAQATKGIGYKEFFPYFSGEMNLETAVAKVKQNSRRYAKRQLTWFKNRMKVDFYFLTDPDWQEKIFKTVERFIQKN